ncbi:MAG TPA: phytanoyl-CoA dioxygenase family protein [Streptosporangiaceae bacterium]|nr:phytanoyl-CoA dioxygenase family protein [Streptosporangiaceae bacterium]
MRELTDSAALRADPARLRARLAADGYLFLRGLLPAADVRTAHDDVLAALRDGGWADRSGRPADPDRTVNFRQALADPVFRAALITRGLNRLPYLPSLRQLVRSILGPAAFSYPVKVLRTVYPERPHQPVTLGRYVHQDYQNSGVQDMLTTWLPLMEIPAALGGLAVLPGSHLGAPVRPRLLQPAEPGWLSADYQPGDVLLFHCMTAHAALPNGAQKIRLSTDCRWQRPDQPAPAEMVLGPARRGQLGQPVELYSRLLRRERWWEPVPAGLALQPRERLAAAAAPPAPSRLFAVHPGWQYWRPPGGPMR